MAHINRLDEDGVRFRSIVDGAWVDLGPERSMEVQNNIGADIIMAFDECPPAGDPQDVAGFRKRVTTDGHRGLAHHERLRDAHERTVRWLDRCVAHQRPTDQALGHCPGAPISNPAASVEAICQHDLPGFAVGGVAVENVLSKIPRSWRSLHHAAKRRSRYLMGWDTNRHRACGPQNRHVRLRPSDPKRSKCPSLHAFGTHESQNAAC